MRQMDDSVAASAGHKPTFLHERRRTSPIERSASRPPVTRNAQPAHALLLHPAALSNISQSQCIFNCSQLSNLI